MTPDYAFEIGAYTPVEGIPDPPEQLILPENTPITSDIVKWAMEKHQENLNRYRLLQDYYNGKTRILNRYKDKDKSNNKLVSAYPAYIVDVIQGYFIGNPVKYSVPDDLRDEFSVVSDVFTENDEQDENTEMAKMAGIKGRAYELVYTEKVDDEIKIRFNELEPEDAFVIYDDKIKPEIMFGFLPYRTVDLNNLNNEGIQAVTVYDNKYKYTFHLTSSGYKQVTEPEEHLFGEVPLIEAMNNDEGMGDFERVITLIDAYEKAQSDTANDFEEFTDAYLGLSNMMGTTAEDVIKLKKERILLFAENQSAAWIIKDINDKAVENYKGRLDNDIHKFSRVPNMGDEQFAGNVSGESMKYKLLALDQTIVTKQRKFKNALQRRLKLILNVLKLRGEVSELSYRDVDITFTPNRPVNEKEAVEMAVALKGIVSEETAISALPSRIVPETGSEIEKLEEERLGYYNIEDFEVEDDVDEE